MNSFIVPLRPVDSKTSRSTVTQYDLGYHSTVNLFLIETHNLVHTKLLTINKGLYSVVGIFKSLSIGLEDGSIIVESGTQKDLFYCYTRRGLTSGKPWQRNCGNSWTLTSHTKTITTSIHRLFTLDLTSKSHIPVFRKSFLFSSCLIWFYVWLPTLIRYVGLGFPLSLYIGRLICWLGREAQSTEQKGFEGTTTLILFLTD